MRAVLPVRRRQLELRLCDRQIGGAALVERKSGALVTVIAVYRIPGEGAVLCADGRVTSGSSIITDTCDKWQVCGSVVLGIYGADGGLPQALEPAKNWAEVMKRATEYTTGKPLDWGLLAYDRRADRVVLGDSAGGEYSTLNIFAVGAGGDYAQGWLDGQKKAKSLNEAARLCKQALKAVFRRDASCGGRIKTLIVRGKRGAVQLL